MSYLSDRYKRDSKSTFRPKKYFTFLQKGILFHIFRPRVGEEKREKVFEKVFDRFTESRSLEAQNEGWMDGFQ